MFFFASCCQQFDTGEGFQIRQPTINNNFELSFAHSLDQIKKEILLQQKNQIIKIKKSQYQELLQSFKNTNKMWIDQQFPPQKSSLGGLKVQAKWKRLSEIVHNPQIFSGKISPISIQDDYKQQLFQQNPFYCTIAILAEHQEIIKNLFVGVKFSRAGLYKVPLRVDGQIEQIIIDDFVPVYPNNLPIFSSSVSNQIWLYLIQKAWAKVMGGYNNINNEPNQIIKAITWAPCEQVYMKQSEEERKKLWEKLLYCTSKKYPCICETLSGDQQEVDFSQSGLLQTQLYSILEAFNIEDQKGRLHQVLKIRSIVGIENLKISINPQHILWQLVCQAYKGKGSQINQLKSQNIFFIRFQELCKYFCKIIFSYYEPQSNFLSETVMVNSSKGFLYKFDVIKEGRYSIQLHQPTSVKSSFQQRENQNQTSYKRGTIILIDQKIEQLSFVDGILSLNNKVTLLSIDLMPGKYIIYSKFDFNKQSIFQTRYSVSIYSKYFTKMIKTERQAYPNVLQRIFLHYGRENPRNKHNNDLMWISYRLFFKQGGFAFVALGNKPESTKKFIITFDEKEFLKMNFKLKKPFKNVDGVQKLQVMPGDQKIILARCMESNNLKSLKFPPQLGIKIQPIDDRQMLPNES